MRHVLVDLEGDLHIRVLAFNGRSFAPVLLNLGSLLEALDDWQYEIDEALAGIVRAACVCPQHLGILGSKMALRYEGAEGWNIVLDASVRSRTQERSRYKYARAHHAFPMVGDDYLLPTLDNRTFFYATGASLTAISVAELAERAGVEKHDSLVHQEWETDDPYMVILPLASAGMAIDNVKLPDAESECVARCERLEARMLELAPPPPPPPPPPALQDVTLLPAGPSSAQEPPARKKPGRRPPRQSP